jgi:hypothetical protein
MIRVALKGIFEFPVNIHDHQIVFCLLILQRLNRFCDVIEIVTLLCGLTGR